VRRRTIFLTGLAVVVPAGAASAAPVLRVEAGGDQVRATPGVACVQIAGKDGGPRGRCSGRRYPLHTRGRVALRGGERVQLRFSRPPGVVKWRLLRSASSHPRTVLAGQAHRSPAGRGRFAFTLPRRVPCAAVLDVYATYGAGSGKRDHVWWAGVRTPACKGA